MKNKKGFTLVEVVITIVVVGILSMVSVPIYRNYVTKTYESEGRALLGSILTEEKHFCIDNDSFANEAETSIGTNINVNASENKYFRTFSVVANGEESFTATTKGVGAANGTTLTLEYSQNGTNVYVTHENDSSGGNSNSGNSNSGNSSNLTQVSSANFDAWLLENGVSVNNFIETTGWTQSISGPGTVGPWFANIVNPNTSNRNWYVNVFISDGRLRRATGTSNDNNNLILTKKGWDLLYGYSPAAGTAAAAAFGIEIVN